MSAGNPWASGLWTIKITVQSEGASAWDMSETWCGPIEAAVQITRSLFHLHLWWAAVADDDESISDGQYQFGLWRLLRHVVTCGMRRSGHNNVSLSHSTTRDEKTRVVRSTSTRNGASSAVTRPWHLGVVHVRNNLSSMNECDGG